LTPLIDSGRINIAQWENVRWTSWQGNQLVLGELVPAPIGTMLNLQFPECGSSKTPQEPR
jgi:hypothetical protein